MSKNLTDQCVSSEIQRQASRRWFLQQCGVGLGAIALRDLMASENAIAADSSRDPLAARPSHFPARAKNVIFLFMAGAPSHLELFDYKPQLAKFDGTLPPAELLKGYRAAFINPNSTLLGPKFSLPGTGSAEPNCRNCCHIFQLLWTTLRS